MSERPSSPGTGADASAGPAGGGVSGRGLGLSRPAAAVGVVAAVGGLAVVLTGAVGPFEVEYPIAVIVGLLALVQGLRYGLERRRTDYRGTTVDDPEDRYAAAPPGADFDDLLARGESYAGATARSAAVDRLRAAAADVVAAAEGCSREAAADRIEAGTWTDDPAAAAFLAGDRYPLRTTLAALVARESRFRFGVRRSVAALAALQDRDGDEGDDRDPTEAGRP